MGVGLADARHSGAGAQGALANLLLDLREGAQHVEPLALEALVHFLGGLLEEHKGLAVVA